MSRQPWHTEHDGVMHNSLATIASFGSGREATQAVVDMCKWAYDEIAKCDISIAELKAENERLREACRDAWSGLRYVRREYGKLSGVEFDRVDKKCEEALGEKTPYTREALAGGKETTDAA